VSTDRSQRHRNRASARAENQPRSAELADSFTLYSQCATRTARVTFAQERELFRRYEAGDAGAATRLIEANLRLVIWVARRYANLGVPLLDLIQEGNVALTRAVHKFDYRLGWRFSTYATLLIRQAVEQAAARHARGFGMPVHVWKQAGHVRRSRQQLTQRLAREPQLAELAAETGLEPRRIEELLRLGQEPISLEGVTGHGDSSPVELLVDTASPPPDAAVVDQQRSESVSIALRVLDDRLRLVLDLRYGLSGGPPSSLEEIGRHLGVTRERARQLEARALETLRERAPDLREYVNAA
jgi:RNA polymerase primary sigma factor